MNVTLDSANPRSLRGVTLAAEARQWLRLTTKDGQEAFGIPSSRDPLKFWRVTEDNCDCPDHRFRERACSHIFAVRLYRLLSGGVVTQPTLRETDEKFWGRFEGE